MEVRAAMARRTAARGRAPNTVILQNHGIFVAGDTPEEVRAHYAHILTALRAEYAAARVATELPATPPPDAALDAGTRAQLRALLGSDAAHIAVSGPFAAPEGPLSPDHIVYARSYLHFGAITAASVAAFRARHGYAPRVFVTEDGAWATGLTEKDAALALLFACDGARVRQLAEAFGGARYLDDRAREFIENWEVESYRRKVAVGDAESTGERRAPAR